MLYEDVPIREEWIRRVNRRWTDSFQGPFQNREIEWIEISGAGANAVRQQVMTLGKLPLIDQEDGFRLIAYGPIQMLASKERQT